MPEPLNASSSLGMIDSPSTATAPTKGPEKRRQASAVAAYVSAASPLFASSPLTSL